jgi:anti-sigma factor RsiW
MIEKIGDQGRLRADLAQLRVALHSLDPPPVDEAALRAAFRQERQRALAAAAPPRGASKRALAVFAAAVVLTVGVVAGILLTESDPVTSVAPAEAVAQAPQPAVAAFQPLLNSPGFSPAVSYSVVRVRIPLASFALLPGTEQGGTIEADLLVGEDGLARGIRFHEGDAMLASAISR